MKKAKLFLTIVTSMGIAGGILALKAEKFGADRYCYTTTTASGAQCTLTLPDGIFFLNCNGSYKYVTIAPGEGCPKP